MVNGGREKESVRRLAQQAQSKGESGNVLLIHVGNNNRFCGVCQIFMPVQYIMAEKESSGLLGKGANLPANLLGYNVC